jgi:hypothetical protein
MMILVIVSVVPESQFPLILALQKAVIVINVITILITEQLAGMRLEKVIIRQYVLCVMQKLYLTKHVITSTTSVRSVERIQLSVTALSVAETSVMVQIMLTMRVRYYTLAVPPETAEEKKSFIIAAVI